MSDSYNINQNNEVINYLMTSEEEEEEEEEEERDGEEQGDGGVVPMDEDIDLAKEKEEDEEMALVFVDGKEESQIGKEGGTGGAAAASNATKGLFTKELKQMMYGFGDEIKPLPESVALMEEIALEFIRETVMKAQGVWLAKATSKGGGTASVSAASAGGSASGGGSGGGGGASSAVMGKLTTEDLLFVLKRDRKKLARVQNLLSMEAELKSARKAFEMDKLDDVAAEGDFHGPAPVIDKPPAPAGGGVGL
eukprot:Nk52_evm40s250 gene=Nk52_evmTU40s250